MSDNDNDFFLGMYATSDDEEVDFWAETYMLSELNKRNDPPKKKNSRYNSNEKLVFWFIGFWIFVAIISHLS